MKKANYKGKCEKRKLSKCEGICKTYSKLQTVFADILEADDEVVSFECNVDMKGVADNQYSTDFVAVKDDGTKMVRECVWHRNLERPSYSSLTARIYWICYPMMKSIYPRLAAVQERIASKKRHCFALFRMRIQPGMPSLGCYTARFFRNYIFRQIIRVKRVN